MFVFVIVLIQMINDYIWKNYMKKSNSNQLYCVNYLNLLLKKSNEK